MDRLVKKLNFSVRSGENTINTNKKTMVNSEKPFQAIPLGMAFVIFLLFVDVYSCLFWFKNIKKYYIKITLQINQIPKIT